LKPNSPVQRRLHRAALELFASGTTDVNVKQLAETAGVVRGTVYKHLSTPETLFQDVAAALSAEMIVLVDETIRGISDPAYRLSYGLRLFVRRAHEEPNWGRFMTRFGFSVPALRSLWDDLPAKDLLAGVNTGRYTLRIEQIPSALATLAGAGLGAITLVCEGQRTWRDAGADATEFLLKAWGVAADEARQVATVELPVLTNQLDHVPRRNPS
jgi:AcrR family transcriptional regulator